MECATSERVQQCPALEVQRSSAGSSLVARVTRFEQRFANTLRSILRNHLLVPCSWRRCAHLRDKPVGGRD